MNIEPFAVEIWMNAHETRCRHNLAETCVDSITLGALTDLAGKTDALLSELLPMKLTYGSIAGSTRLREAIAGLYAGRSASEVLVTHGAIGANALVYASLIEPGDEVVSVVPTYQQHTAIPESYGAVVKRLPLRSQQGYRLDLAELAAAVRPATKLITLTNPNNPTGSMMDGAELRGLVDIAARNEAWVLCDEVYRGVNQAGDALSPSIAEIYPRGIAVGSMSKAFALAGLRLGWIVGTHDLLHDVMLHRDYNTISVGMLDEHVAAIALENSAALLARNRSIVRANLAILAEWMAGEPSLSWVRPSGGTVTLLRFAADMPSERFCTRLLAETGVLLVPGSAFGMEGTVRLGFGNPTETLKTGLAEISRFLRTLGG